MTSLAAVEPARITVNYETNMLHLNCTYRGVVTLTVNDWRL